MGRSRSVSLVFDRTHSALAMTGLWICTLLVPALVGPAATAQLDRLGVRRVLPALYLAEAAIFAALALLTSSPWLPLVLVLAAADGILALVGRALTRAAVAATLKPDGELDAGNTLLNVSFSLCFAIGPAIGGLVIAAWGVSAALWVSAGLFAAMSITLATSRALPPAHADAARRGSRACARASATRSETWRSAASSSRTRSRSSAPR